jgi:sialate O-acetylesterase
MNPKHFLFRALPAIALLLSTTAAWCEVRLAGLFTDQAVLQQRMPIKVWGWADPGETVTVEFRTQKVSAKTAGSGRWMATLKAEKAGGPDTLKVSGSSVVTLKDVMVGEVWVASGQSNMEWLMSKSYQPEDDIAASANPMVRHFNVPKLKADSPVSDVKGNWQVAGPATTPGFSAVAYYFSRELQKALKVPVGIIHTSWGGSPAEVWMSSRVLEGNAEYKRDVLDAYLPQKARFEDSLAKWQAAKAQAQKDGKPFTTQAPRASWKPTELYNGMIAPLIPYAIRGAIWYQGESNAGKAWQYRRLYADMIRNWRQDWGVGDFTFLCVQLAPYDQNRKRSIAEITTAPVESNWAELREAQVISTKVLKNCGLAVITDVGEKDDIHPTKKASVGARLALQARKIAYREKIVASGPAYKSLKIKGDHAILSFDDVGGGLEARGGELTGFAICGADKKFVWGKAVIEDEEVVVSSPQVTAPVAVRYGWADFPVVNLFNKEGLPASPFRTDDFPMITGPK